MRRKNLFYTQVFNPIFLLILESGDVISSACSAANDICYCEHSSVYISENKVQSKCCDDHNNTTCFRNEQFPIINYCSGEAKCYGYDPHLDENHPDILEKIMLCFSGTECFAFSENTSSVVDSCFGSPVSLVNISNSVGIWSLYRCFAFLSSQQPSCCIRPECSSFSILERKCQCDDSQYSCLCYNNCDLANIKLTYNAHAVFISFGDFYISEQKNTAIVILIIMLVILAAIVILLSFKRVYWSSAIPGSSLIAATYTNAESVDGNINQMLSSGSVPDGLERNVSAEPCTVRNSTGTGDSNLPSYYEAINSERKAVDPPPKYDSTNK